MAKKARKTSLAKKTKRATTKAKTPSKPSPTWLKEPVQPGHMHVGIALGDPVLGKTGGELRAAVERVLDLVQRNESMPTGLICQGKCIQLKEEVCYTYKTCQICDNYEIPKDPPEIPKPPQRR